MRKIPRAAIPNAVTALCLLCGYLSVLNTLQGHYQHAAYFSLYAGFLDILDGSLAKFKDAGKDVYQVPTLVSGDGVHPSNPQKFSDYSEEGLRSNGYVLRNYLTLMSYADVIGKVLQPK